MTVNRHTMRNVEIIMIDETPKEIENIGEMVGAVEEISLQRMLFQYNGYMEKVDEWLNVQPRDVLNNILNRMPEVVEEISAYDAHKMIKKTHLSNGAQSVYDHGTPTEIEAYFIFKLIQLDKDALNIDVVNTSVAGDNFLPRESIKCLRDTVRTRVFVNAVRTAIDKLVTKKDIVHVIDAGSGAFPIMSIMAALHSDKVRCVCVESNKLSVRLATDLVKALGLETQITIVHADATKYVPDNSVDLVVSETMDSGLTSEPQCEIQNHLAQYIGDNTIFLPNKIETFATIVSKSAYVNAEVFYKIDQSVYPKLEYNWVKTSEFKPGDKVPTITGYLQNSDKQEDAMVLVASKVYLGDAVLDISESRITMPIFVGDIAKVGWLNSQINNHKLVCISYKPGDTLDKISPSP